TSLIIIEEYGLIATLLSVVMNILITGGIFSISSIIQKILGENGTRALSKITNILLAAIAVMMVRRGLISLLG
ncbi:MAG: MarC family protein, partial [Spirochaetes bacterium]